MKTPTIRLAVRMLVRDLRAGDLRVLLAALLVAVASVATVGFFTDRVRGALANEAARLLGGDLALVTGQPPADEYAQQAARLGLATAHTVIFPSMASTPEQATLTDIKAVSDSYPLRGKMRIADQPGGNEREATGAPPAGTVWVAERTLINLDAKIGDEIELGAKTFRIGAVVTYEPDNAFNYFNVAPRVMMNLADLAATELIQTGSRVRYRLLVAGAQKPLAAFTAFANERIGRGERLDTVRDTRSEVRSALNRAEQFLGLASLLSVILAAVGVALASRRFMQRELDTCAIMRCLGASQATLLKLYLAEFALLGVAAGVVGCALGFIAQYGLAYLLADLIQVPLPLPTATPVWQAFAVGVLLLAGFALPPLLRLKSVPTLRVLRREMGVAPLSISAYFAGMAVIALLLYWRAGDVKIWGWVMLGIAGCLILSALLGYLMVNAAARLRGAGGVAFRYGLASLKRRRASSVTQMVSLGLGIMALLLLTLVRGDLLNAWRNNLPPDAPNRFVIGIQPDQVDDVRRFLAQSGLGAPELYPMVRGRLTHINGGALDVDSLTDERSRRLAEREFNLSYATHNRPDNLIVAGRFWKPDARDAREFSVEEGIAQTLNIRMGDVLTYRVAGQTVEGKVTSLRKVNWDSFKANFFVIGTPGMLERMPASYLTSFHVARAQEPAANQLVRKFPNLSLIDVGAILDQVRAIGDQVSRAVEFVFLFTLAAGLIVLYAAIVSSQDERIYEAAIMRTLGARRGQLVLAQLAEFMAIGLLAGTIAAIFATAVGYVVSVKVLNLGYEFNALVPAFGIVLGAAGVVLAGLSATFSTLNRPPLQTIRGLG